MASQSQPFEAELAVSGRPVAVARFAGAALIVLHNGDVFFPAQGLRREDGLGCAGAAVQEHQHRVVVARAADGHEVVDAARGDVAGFVDRPAGVTEQAGVAATQPGAAEDGAGDAHDALPIPVSAT